MSESPITTDEQLDHVVLISRQAATSSDLWR